MPANDIRSVRVNVRSLALADFEYFANTVLAAGLKDDICDAAQAAVADGQDACVFTHRPRALLNALAAWLRVHGFEVVSDATVQHSEILQWLALDGTADTDVPARGAVALSVTAHGVVLQWL